MAARMDTVDFEDIDVIDEYDDEYDGVVIEPHVPAARSGWRKCCGFGWLKKPLGILKLVQFFMVVIPLIALGGSTSQFADIKVTVEFFLFVQSACFIMIILTLLCYVTDRMHRLPMIMMRNLTWAIQCGVGCFMQMASSSALIALSKGNETALASGAFGLMTMFMLMFETIYFIYVVRRDGKGAVTGVAVFRRN